MMVTGGGGRGARQRQAAIDEERRDYLRYLGHDPAPVSGRSPPSSGRPLEHVHPDPAAWPAVARGGPAVGAPRVPTPTSASSASAAARSGWRPA